MSRRGAGRRPAGRAARALRAALALLAVAVAGTAALLWPALVADVGRLTTKWPDTLPPERRPPTWTPLRAIDPKLHWAVVAAEDARFFTHDGIDWDATLNAVRTNLDRGRYVLGGSTITQQLAKNLFLSREKSLLRKAREAVLAWRLEAALSKRRILELYLNVAEWGHGIYGAEAAARYHLGHSAARLTWGEAATLAAILPSPVNKLDPDRAPGRVRRRRARILAELHRQGRLTQEEMVAARAAPLTAAEARAAAAAEAREAAEAEAREAARMAPRAGAAHPALPPGTSPPVEPADAVASGGAGAGDAAGDRAVLEVVVSPSGPSPWTRRGQPKPSGTP